MLDKFEYTEESTLKYYNYAFEDNSPHCICYIAPYDSIHLIRKLISRYEPVSYTYIKERVELEKTYDKNVI